MNQSGEGTAGGALQLVCAVCRSGSRQTSGGRTGSLATSATPPISCNGPLVNSSWLACRLRRPTFCTEAFAGTFESIDVVGDPRPQGKYLQQQFTADGSQLVFDARRTSRHIVRVTNPSRSTCRSVFVSIFWLMPSTRLSTREKRRRPPVARTYIVQSDHLSATRAMISRTNASS